MQSKNRPRISICIPTFNRADLLRQTLQSVAQQTIKPYQVVVVDNCSNDGTDEVGRYYKEKYGYTFIKNKKNLGMIGNWNKAIAHSKGEYVCLLHSDDLISPDWHETWLSTISQYKADFYTSAIAIINDKNVPLFTAHIFNSDQYMRQPLTMKLFLGKLAPMIAPSGASIYSRMALKKIGSFDPIHKTEADVPHFLKLASTYDVYYRNRIVFAWRTHEAQTFEKADVKKTVDAELARLDNYFKIISRFYKHHYKNSSEWRIFIQTHIFMSLSAINLHLVKGRIKKIRESYRIARKYFPDIFRSLDDWRQFVKIQFVLIKRALTLKRINREDKKTLSWLKTIAMSKSEIS